MKFLLAASSLVALSTAFSPAAFVSMRTSNRAAAFGIASRPASAVSSSLAMSSNMESDFATAMPEKPAVPIKEHLANSAQDFVTRVKSNLGEGVEEPPELAALESALEAYGDGEGDDVSVSDLSQKIYELMIETGMRYDRDEDGIMTPTNFDIPNNLDVPEVKNEFMYLYQYGMTLIANGLIVKDDMKDIVKERLIKRTGLEPEEFDKWLGFY